MGYGKKEFYEKYKTYLILHIDNFFDNFRYAIFDFCKAYKGDILVISHDKSFINDKIWDNLINIEFYNFANDKKKINYLSRIENHLFYNTKFILNIVNTGKNKTNFILKFFDKRNEHDNKDIKFLQKNFKLKKINCDLKPGFSFIIRAKNESLNVLYCLKTLVPILELYKDSEIIFVDNKSADNTFEIAKNILSEFNNTKVLRYNVEVPKCGELHKKIVSENRELSLGTYYKWCYSFASKYMVIKWDCDFLCNLPVLIEMINKYKLKNNNSDLSIWFSGQQIFINDNIYLDTESYFLYNEPRIHSKLNGFEYIDSRDLLWETAFTKNFVENEKKDRSYHFGFPTSFYLLRYFKRKKLVRKKYSSKMHEYFDKIYCKNNRNEIIRQNKRKKNFKIIENFLDNNNKTFNELMKKHLKEDEKIVFYEIKHVDMLYNKIKNNELKNIDSRDHKIIDLVTNIKQNKIPKNIIKNEYLKNKLAILNKKEINVCVIILTCEKYKKRIENLKEKLLDNLKYKYYLVNCNQNMEEKWMVKDNQLFVNCEECYENLPKKVLLSYEYIYKKTDFDYVIKIDDDTFINEVRLDEFVNKNFYNLDYLGAIAGGHVEKDWHFGKCKDEKLNKKLYWNEYYGYWCGGGFGYILSRSAISLLLENKNYQYIWDEIYEDKAIGDVLRKEKILPCFEFLPELKISKKVGMIGNDYIFISKH